MAIYWAVHQPPTHFAFNFNRTAKESSPFTCPAINYATGGTFVFGCSTSAPDNKKKKMPRVDATQRIVSANGQRWSDSYSNFRLLFAADSHWLPIRYNGSQSDYLDRLFPHLPLGSLRHSSMFRRLEINLTFIFIK